MPFLIYGSKRWTQDSTSVRCQLPLDTGWISWVILATVVIWLVVTQNLRGQIIGGKPAGRPGAFEEIECERFPDQCPCTTELGKGVA